MTEVIPDPWYLAAVLATVFAINVTLRAAPFAALKPLRASVLVQRLSVWMPVGVLPILAAETLRRTFVEDPAQVLSAVVAVALTVAVHLLGGRRTLLSVGAGYVRLCAAGQPRRRVRARRCLPRESMMSDAAAAYFVRLDEDHFRPTEWVGGAWTTTEQHISPVNGLITHAVERFCADRGPDGMAISRISVDILGVLSMEPFEVAVSVVRPGRTIELLEAVVISAGRAAVIARIWRAIELDTAIVAGGEVEPLPGREEAEPMDLTEVWPGGYIGSIKLRSIGAVKPGRATVWIMSHADLVEDEPVSDLARLMGLVDTANGLCVRQRIDEWLFPNVDLTIHLLRQPAGAWLGLDVTVVFGPAGHGVTSSVLHDANGHLGYANQTLTIRPR